MYDIIIRKGTVIDGTGEKMTSCDVAIKDGKIVGLGDYKKDTAKNEINADGKYVVPGFVDINNDSDHYLSLFEQPQAENLIRQGITTILCGTCGASLAPLLRGSLITIRKWVGSEKYNVNWRTFKEFLDILEKKGFGVNFASLTGWATLRRDLTNDEFRTLTKDEFDKAKKILSQSLIDGSFGVSFGLGYSHEKMVGLSEMVPVGEMMVKEKALVSIHLRDESANMLSALDEAIEVAKQSEASIEISHFKILGTPYWDQFGEALVKVDNANHQGWKVNFDVYPYDINAQVLYLVLPEWIAVGGRQNLIKNLRHPSTRQKALEDLKKNRHLYEHLIIADPADKWMLAGKTLEEIASNEGISLEEALLKILELTEDRTIVFSPNLSEKNVIHAMQSPYALICSNGAAYNLDQIKRGILVHPRAFGAMPRFLGHYVKQENIMDMEEGIAKITGRPAVKIGLKNRGLLKKDYWADVVIFNPEKIMDRATITNPYQYPDGIETVLLNGHLAYHKGLLDKTLHGKILRKGK